uniref:Tudor domain-containing protein n=1 Tax=Setaria digitata TaxID=48799 RepID=A0A915Q7Z6_9BILA
MKKIQTTQRATENWIADNEVRTKSLWLRRDGFSVRLMAKTKEPPVSLLLPLDSCFDVRILRIDYAHGFVFVRPLVEDDHYKQLQQKLIKHALGEHVRATNLNEDTIYLASNSEGIFRGALVGQPSAINLLYGIDVGETKLMNARNVYQLPTDLQSFPPLCFCGLLPNCTTNFEYEDISLIKMNSICLCKIYKVLPPHFSDYPTMMYPPIVFIQLFKFTGNRNKYVEVIFRGFVKKSGIGVCNGLESFTFKPYSVKLPCQVKAIVTAKIRRNVYWMRDADILSILAENMVDPGKYSKYSLVDLAGWHEKMCCLVRLARPFRGDSPYGRFSVYRAAITHFHKGTDTCLAYLVDFGLSVVCSMKNLYSYREQPAVIRETSTAAFRCHVSKLLKEELYVMQLSYQHKDFYVCDMLFRMHSLKHEIELESANNMRDESISNLTSADVSIEGSSSKETNNERFEMGHCNQQWFQPDLNSSCRNNNRTARSEVTLTSIQLGVLEISEKIDNITNAKLASLQVAMESCGHGRTTKHMSSLQQSCQNSTESSSIPIIKSVQMEHFRFGRPLYEAVFPESSYNFRGTHTIMNRSDTGNRKPHGAVANHELPLELPRYVQSRHVAPSIIPVVVPVAVPLQCSDCQTWNSEHGRHSYYQYNNYGYQQLNDNKLEIKKANFREEICKHPSDGSMERVKEWQHDKHQEKRPFINKTDIATNLLEKELVLDITEPVTIERRKYIPAYQVLNFCDYSEFYVAFFEHVKVNEGDEVLVKRSDDDHENKNWPLFFVQIQRDDLLDVLEEQLDSLQPTTSVSEQELQVGTLCLSFCRAFESMFRAVITNICNADIEVHYIDYGNYETVNRDDLKSINNLPDIARTHPGMAIPCMLLSSCVAATVSDCMEAESEIAATLKSAVSCEHHSFRIRVLKIRDDGICIVEYISP